MEVILDFLIYIIVEIVLQYIIFYPGAALIWILKGGKKNFINITDNDRTISWLSGLAILIGIIALIQLLIK
jgi:hypothetical protein